MHLKQRRKKNLNILRTQFTNCTTYTVATVRQFAKMSYLSHGDNKNDTVSTCFFFKRCVYEMKFK